MGRLLEVRDLRTHFFIQDGVVKAVNGVSYSLGEAETQPGQAGEPEHRLAGRRRLGGAADELAS